MCIALTTPYTFIMNSFISYLFCMHFHQWELSVTELIYGWLLMYYLINFGWVKSTARLFDAFVSCAQDISLTMRLPSIFVSIFELPSLSFMLASVWTIKQLTILRMMSKGRKLIGLSCINSSEINHDVFLLRTYKKLIYNVKISNGRLLRKVSLDL